MKPTENNKKQRWLNYAKKLKAWEIKFIELHNEGFGYNEIRDLLAKDFTKFKRSFKDNAALRALVYTGGRLYEAKLLYGEIAAEESFEAGQQVIKNAHRRAAMTVANLLSSTAQEHVRLGAAKDILDRNAGKATQPMEIKDNQEMEELRSKVNKMTQPNGNIARIANRIKRKSGGTAKGKGSS